MNRAVKTSLVVVVLFLGGVFQSLNVANGQTQDISYVIKMSITYRNPSNGAQTWNFTEEDKTISLFMNNTWQNVQLINSSFPIDTRENDTDGNPIAVLRFPIAQLSSGQSLNFSATYGVISKPRVLPSISEEGSSVLQDITKDLIDKYCGEEGPWLITNSTIQNLAHSIAGNETRVLTIVKKLVTWIHNHLAYMVHEVPLYANETLTEGRGDCDDQAILLITLSRILGIPAYLQVGAIYMPTISDTSTYWEGHVQEVSRRIGWHGWAIVYVPPWGWLPVDLTFAEGGVADPIKAITNAAARSQSVIQYMNVTKFNYVASSRQSRDFLIRNNFYVYLDDEMIVESGQQNPLSEGFREWLIAGLIVSGAILLASSLLISRKFTRRRVEAEVQKPQQ